MAIDPVALKDEILNGPFNAEIAPHITSGSDTLIAKVLNERRGTIIITKASISRDELLLAVNLSDVKSLGATERGVFISLLASEAVPGKTALELADFFPPANSSRVSLEAATRREGSQIEKRFGVGTSISHLDVARALGRAG